MSTRWRVVFVGLGVAVLLGIGALLAVASRDSDPPRSPPMTVIATDTADADTPCEVHARAEKLAEDPGASRIDQDHYAALACP